MELVCDDCLKWLDVRAPKSVDLVFGSPPYEDARSYGIEFALRGQDWVDWMAERMMQMVRVCKGLVAMVVEGKTRNYQWSATPALLMADLHRRGAVLRKPPIYQRHGIPGSGGPDWLRNDYEFIVCCTSGDRLPFADTLAMGWPCKYRTGGAFSYRTEDGRRINEAKHSAGSENAKARTRRGRPEITNPGNVIECKVGKGHMGSALAHENEAPFTESLAEFFVRSFCPPGGIVLDPFCGSGTTGAVALKHGRDFIGIDCRESQIELTERRLQEAVPA